MREGRQLVRESRRFAVEQPLRSWWSFLSTLAVFAAALYAAVAQGSWIVRGFACIVVSLVHVRFFVLYHDHLHGNILERSRVAAFLFRVYGLLTLAPPSIWKDTHDHHHRNNSRRFGLDSVGSFPVMTADSFRSSGLGARWLYVVARHPLTIVFGYLTVFLFGFCIQPLLTDPKRHLDAAASMLLHAGVVIWLLAVAPDSAFFAVILPSFLASAIGTYLFYAQHNFPAVRLRPGREWDYVFAALRSSSFIKMNPIMQWFTGNIGYHHVHHLNSRIPFYRLPEAMASIEGLQSPSTTTLKPAEIRRCLRLKLWDPQQDRMITFREARRAAAAATT